MPNSRRRRFSVQKEIRGRETTKLQNVSQFRAQLLAPPTLLPIAPTQDTPYHDLPAPGSPVSYDFLYPSTGSGNVYSIPTRIRPPPITDPTDPDQDSKSLAQNLNSVNASKLKSKCFLSTSKNSSTLEIVAECESTSSESAVKKHSSTAVDKDVTANSSTIDLFNILNAANNLSLNQSKDTIPYSKDDDRKREERPTYTDKIPVRRDKFPRQHRIKVRSPKRRIPIPEEHKKADPLHKSVGVNPIDWGHESEIQIEGIGDLEEEIEMGQRSDQTLDDMCRICHGGDTLNPELGQMISACSCRGTVGRVHVKCLERWLTESGKSRCELCGTRYATRRVHRYGVPRALVMWILSQNAKQLMVDGLGIMLMSPLAVLAAWLSGRTLAGLMTYESSVTPWPLASTFVLACMTLVCYYCWIVSAATRHALAWWIWYRSQYEVRLQLHEEQED